MGRCGEPDWLAHLDQFSFNMRAHTRMHTTAHTHTHTHMCMHARAHKRTHTHMCMHARAHKRTHTHTQCRVADEIASGGGGLAEDAAVSLATTYTTPLDHGGTLAQLIDNSANAGQIEQVADARDTTKEVDHHWEEAAEENEEAVRFHTHTYDRPAKQHDQDPAEETARTAQLVLLEEETKRPLQADDKSQASQKQNVTHGQQTFVEHHQHAEEDESDAESRQANANLLIIADCGKHGASCFLLTTPISPLLL